MHHMNVLSNYIVSQRRLVVVSVAAAGALASVQNFQEHSNE